MHSPTQTLIQHTSPVRSAAKANELSFQRVQHGEPHLQRRTALLKAHPELRRFFGHDVRTAYLTVALVVTQLSLACLFQWAHDAGSWTGSMWVLVPVSFFVGAVLSHWLSMAIHECSHNLAARKARTNRWISMLANLPLLVPCAMSFNRYHIAHHTHLGVDEKDTDLAQSFEFKLVGTSPVRKFVVLLLFPGLYLLRGAMFCKRPNRLELLNAVIQIALVVVLVTVVGWIPVLYLGLSFWFGHSIHPVAGHFIHEHYMWHDDQETYSYYGPLNHVTFNVGYHYEHHDFMNVPGWRLPELRRALEPHYQNLKSHSSWTKVYVRYVLDRTIGPHSRTVRTNETFLNARKSARRNPAYTAVTSPEQTPSMKAAA